MSNALKGGAPRGYPIGAERVISAPVATRRTGRADADGTVWHGDRTDVYIVYVAPFSDAHRQFRRWADRNDMTVRTVGEGARLHDFPEDTAVAHAHENYDATGQFRTHGKDGAPCETQWPVAYRVFGPNLVGTCGGLVFSRKGFPDAPVVEKLHPENVITPLGPGSGQGELGEAAARRLKSQQVESRYRAGERSRGTVSTYLDAPAAPETTVAFDPSVLTHTGGIRNELGDWLAVKGGRITGVRECFGEPGLAWVRFAFPNGKELRKKLPLSPSLPVAPSSPNADERRAQERARISPAATVEELKRAFPAPRI